ncbi:MAG: SPFH domain-containing protein [Armatimonadetes bacterium]|nr:SPFH domain-containing protein [Armatimonadota bacterium]
MTADVTITVIIVALFFFGAIVMPSAVRVIKEYERGVVLRWGRFSHVKLPGLRFIIPFVDTLFRIDLRIVTMDVPKQEMMTRDNVPVTVDAVVYFRVVNAQDAVLKIENFVKATALIAQTTLRSTVGQAMLDELLSEREKINEHLQTVIDEQTEPWGVKVTSVEIRDVILPDGMKRAMAKQAETERERRAKIINAEGEFQAAEKLAQAAAIISKEPAAIQLRFLQTLTEVASEHNSTTIFPVPIDLFEPFIKNLKEKK